jgi:hypothetical protein
MGRASQEKSRSDPVDLVEDAADATSPKEAAVDAATKGQAITGYETLGFWETVNKFRWCTFMCFMAAFSAATDGYQIG